MSKHEFGIIDRDITTTDKFQDYEPQKYGCLTIDDEFIEDIMPLFKDIPTYFHSLTRQEKGLNYIGITLIPPESCIKFITVLKRIETYEYSELIALLEKASRDKHYVIHYGL